MVSVEVPFSPHTLKGDFGTLMRGINCVTVASRSMFSVGTISISSKSHALDVFVNVPFTSQRKGGWWVDATPRGL